MNSNSNLNRLGGRTGCRHGHYHHQRRPAIRQPKRCSFATTTTILNASGNSTTTRRHQMCENSSQSQPLVSITVQPDQMESELDVIQLHSQREQSIELS